MGNNSAVRHVGMVGYDGAMSRSARSPETPIVHHNSHYAPAQVTSPAVQAAYLASTLSA